MLERPEGDVELLLRLAPDRRRGVLVVEQAGDTYVLASAEKLGTVSPYRVLGLDAVSDARADPAALDELRAAAPAVLLAGAD